MVGQRSCLDMEQGDQGFLYKISADSILHCTFSSGTHRLLHFLGPLRMYSISVVRCKGVIITQWVKGGKILLSFNYLLVSFIYIIHIVVLLGFS